MCSGVGDPESASVGITCMGCSSRSPIASVGGFDFSAAPTSVNDVMDSSIIRAHVHDEPCVIEGSYIGGESLLRSPRNLHRWISMATTLKVPAFEYEVNESASH